MRRETMAMCMVIVLALAAASEARADLVIEHVDGSDFAKTGKITFYVDMLSGSGPNRRMPDHVRVIIDGVEVAGTIEVTTFREANLQLGVAALVSATGAYTSELDPEGGNKTRLLALELEGFRRFFERLGPQQRVSAFYYNEEDFRQIAPWSNDPQALGERLVSAGHGGGACLAPQLYGAIERVLTSIKEDTSMPRRRVLVVMSDGSDRTAAGGRERRLEALAQLALTPEVDVEIHSVGFTLGPPEPLVDLGMLAVKTGGVSREIAFDDYATIPEQLEAIADDLMSQRVITFTPEDYAGSEKPVDIRLEISAGGLVMIDGVSGIKVPTKGCRETPLLGKVLLLIGGALLVIGLVAGVLVSVLRSRKTRALKTA